MSTESQKNKMFYLLIAIAGLASGVLFLALVSGGGAMPFFGYFVQLPIFFIGFALGLTGAALASAGSTAIVLTGAGFEAALLYAVSQLLPVLIVIRYALWSRAEANQPLEWYPAGLLLGKLAATILLIATGILAWADRKSVV